MKYLRKLSNILLGVRENPPKISVKLKYTTIFYLHQVRYDGHNVCLTVYFTVNFGPFLNEHMFVDWRKGSLNLKIK